MRFPLRGGAWIQILFMSKSYPAAPVQPQTHQSKTAPVRGLSTTVVMDPPSELASLIWNDTERRADRELIKLICMGYMKDEESISVSIGTTDKHPDLRITTTVSSFDGAATRSLLINDIIKAMVMPSRYMRADPEDALLLVNMSSHMRGTPHERVGVLRQLYMTTPLCGDTDPLGAVRAQNYAYGLTLLSSAHK